MKYKLTNNLPGFIILNMEVGKKIPEHRIRNRRKAPAWNIKRTEGLL